MGWNRFSGSLAFGAVAAAGYAPFALLFAPHLGSGSALGCYALLSVSVYAAGLGATRRQGIGAALLAGALGCAALLVAPSARDLVLAAALILGLVRSGLVHRARFARALLLESLLLGAGLGLSAHLLGGSTLSAVLAVWSFYLVQSLYFLVGGVSPRREESAEVDPFDAARARADAVLEEARG